MGGRPSGRLCEVLEMTMTEASKGWINGFIGMALFSGSLPASRVAVRDFYPTCVTVARAEIAHMLALEVILILRVPRSRFLLMYTLSPMSLVLVLSYSLFLW